MNEEIAKYVKFILYRIWIVIIFAVIFGAAGYLFIKSLAPSYTAEARVFIGYNSLTLSDPGVGVVEVYQRLAPTYAQFARHEDVLQATIDALGLDMSTRSLRSMVSTRIVIDTAILLIRATDNDAERAASIANEVARNLILLSPSSLSPNEGEQMEILSTQIASIQTQIAETNNQYLEVQTELNEAIASGEETRALEERYNLLVEQLTLSRSTLAQLSDNFLSLSNRENRLELVQEAQPPANPGGFSPRMIGAVGAAAGAGFAIATLLLYFEYVDHKLRTTRDVKRALDLPVIGIIRRANEARANFKNVDAKLLASSTAEDYRAIQANLFFSSEKNNKRQIYIITSPNRQEGRSTIVANLGVTASKAGLSTLIIDADMRNPSQDRIFGLANLKGLGVFLETTAANQTILMDDEAFAQALDEHIQDTHFPNLFVMTSGGSELGASPQIMGYENLRRWADRFQALNHFDVILVDVSPNSVAADGYILAGTLDAKIVLLVESGRTTSTSAQRAKDQFVHGGGEITGIVLNKR